tara:strand:- start:158 stop:406 length:249 start_codon:yes stop_codon:yes gene_type:complete
MVRVEYDDKFVKTIKRIKDASVKSSVKNKIAKIMNNPDVGKPMRNVRKGTREVYVGSFRLSYEFHKEEELIEILDLYHKDKQ